MYFVHHATGFQGFQYIMLVDFVLRVLIGVVLLYLLFWAVWFFLHADALYFMLFSKDKKWKATPDSSAHFLSSTSSNVFRGVLPRNTF